MPNIFSKSQYAKNQMEVRIATGSIKWQFILVVDKSMIYTRKGLVNIYWGFGTGEF